MTPEEYYETERYPIMKDKHAKCMHMFSYHDMMQFAEGYAKALSEQCPVSSGTPCSFNIENPDRVEPI